MLRKKFKKDKVKKLTNSFKYAGIGIKDAFVSERNMKIHGFILTMVVVFGIILKISTTEWLICLVLFGMVISAEIFNTSIEGVVDLVSPQIDPLAKKIKDTAAGAVLITAISAAIVGLIIFIPKIIELLK